MTDENRANAFDNRGGTGGELDEEALVRKWQQPAPNEAGLRRAQARRLLGRRPFLRGLAVGAGLLAVSGADLRAAYAQDLHPTTTTTTTAAPTTTTTTTTQAPTTTAAHTTTTTTAAPTTTAAHTTTTTTAAPTTTAGHATTTTTAAHTTTTAAHTTTTARHGTTTTTTKAHSPGTTVAVTLRRRGRH